MINAKKRAEYLYMLPIILFPVALFSTALFTGKSLFWGTPALQFVPWRTLAFSYSLDGIIPLWNPYNGMGAPLAANYQSAVFYPPTWILYFLGFFGPGWNAWGFTLLVVLHLIWSGLGMARLMKRLDYGPMSQLIAGLSFSLCGYFIARAGFFSMIFTGSWLPWLVAAASRLSYPGNLGNQKVYRKSLITFAFTAGMQLLAGHAQLTWYTWILVACWVFVGYWGHGKWTGLWQAFKNLAVVSFLASALAAVQLTLTIEYLLLSQRSTAVAYDTAMTYSFWPWRFLGFIAPDFFGNPGTGNYWGYASFWEDAVYVGLLPFILALLTLPLLLKKRNPEGKSADKTTLVRFLWVFILVSILLSLGKNTPIFPFLYQNIPTFDMFNAPSRYMIWTSFGLCVLSGIGYERWSQPSGKSLYWLRLATAGGFAITLGAFLALRFLDGINVTFIRATTITGLFALISGFLTLFNQKSSSGWKKQIWKWLVVIFIGFDLVFSQWHVNPFMDPQFYSSMEEERGNWTESLRAARVYIHPNTEYFLKFRRFLQFDSYNIAEDWRNMRYVLIPNLNLLEGISMANNFDPLITERFDTWMNLIRDLPAERRAQWLRLMNVGVEVTRAREFENRVQFKPITGNQRFWWFTCGEFVTDKDAAIKTIDGMMNSSRPGYENYIILEGEEDGSLHCEAPQTVQIELMTDKPNHMLLSVDSPQSGWLLISDAYYPGWTVQINGRKETLYKADYVFRAVKLSAGKTSVDLFYSPKSFWIGLSITLLSLIIVFIILKVDEQTKQAVHESENKE